jgi:hypothetical protein
MIAITGEVGPEKPVQSWIDRIGMSPAGLPFLFGALCTASYIIINMINSLAIPMTEEDKEGKVG